MTEKKNKKKEARLYGIKDGESYLHFVVRIVNTENKAMTVGEICKKMDGATRSVRNAVLWHTSCSDAVRKGEIEKTRCPDTKGRNRVHYHPLTLHPIGDEIPRPLFVKQGAIDEPPAFGFKKKFKHQEEDFDDEGAIDEPQDVHTMHDFHKEHAHLANVPLDEHNKGIDLDDLPADPAPANPVDVEDDVQLGNDAMKTIQAWENLSGQERVAVLQLLSSPVKATRTKHIFDAEDLVDTLHAINPRLYEEVLDTIGDAIQIGGTWSRTVTGMMVYNTGEEV